MRKKDEAVRNNKMQGDSFMHAEKIPQREILSSRLRGSRIWKTLRTGLSGVLLLTILLSGIAPQAAHADVAVQTGRSVLERQEKLLIQGPENIFRSGDQGSASLGEMHLLFFDSAAEAEAAKEYYEGVADGVYADGTVYMADSLKVVNSVETSETMQHADPAMYREEKDADSNIEKDAASERDEENVTLSEDAAGICSNSSPEGDPFRKVLALLRENPYEVTAAPGNKDGENEKISGGIISSLENLLTDWSENWRGLFADNSFEEPEQTTKTDNSGNRIEDAESSSFGDHEESLQEKMEEEDRETKEETVLEEKEPLLALLDTGAGDSRNIVKAVSLIGDDPADDNGHGSAMADFISEEAPDARILSVKVLDADGSGDVSAVYAGIYYAMEAGATHILLAFSAERTPDNEVLLQLLQEAAERGIIIVAAAGNNGKEAEETVPGCLEEAYVIGSCDDTGMRLPDSNYGDSVDYYVSAASTSEAAARFAGMCLAEGAVPKADAVRVFSGDEIEEPVREEEGEGPAVQEYILFYDGESGDLRDQVYAYHASMKSTVKDGEIVVPILFSPEDLGKAEEVNVYVDYMSTQSEQVITAACRMDEETLSVCIPESYAEEELSIRLFLPYESYAYTFLADPHFQLQLSARFQAAFDNRGDFDNLTELINYVTRAGYSNIYPYTDGANYVKTTYSTANLSVGDVFTITAGDIAMLDGYINSKSKYSAVLPSHSPQPSTMLFFNHFSEVKDSAGNRMPIFENIGGTGSGSFTVYTSISNSKSVPLSSGWLFGTCAYDEQNGQVPYFQSGRIKVVKKDADGTVYCYYQMASPRAQWTAGCFILKPTATDANAKIGTSAAFSDGKKVALPGPAMEIVDTVKYEGLLAGSTYTLTGQLMRKANGTAVTVGGNAVKVSVSFTPTATSGTVTVRFSFDGSTLEGEEIVVYETLTRSGTTIAEHTDLADSGQMVRILPVPEEPVKTVSRVSNALSDVQRWQIACSIPAAFSSYEPGDLSFVLKDTLDPDKTVLSDKRLSYIGNVVVSLDGAYLVADEDYRVEAPSTGNGMTFSLSMLAPGLTKLKAKAGLADGLLVSFETKLNENALAAEQIPNEAAQEVTICGLTQVSYTGRPSVYTGKIRIRKMTEDGSTPLSGITIALLTEAMEPVLKETEAWQETTDEEGIAEFFGVRDGTYYLREVSTSADHMLLTEPVQVIVEDGKMLEAEDGELVIRNAGSLHLSAGGSGDAGTKTAAVMVLLFAAGMCYNEQNTERKRRVYDAGIHKTKVKTVSGRAASRHPGSFCNSQLPR